MTRYDDDDPLAAFDLSAWDVPPPAQSLVDAVIERARQAAPVAALDSGERIATPVHGKRRGWTVATVAAVAIVAVLVGVLGLQRGPTDGQGEVTAASARTLEIGPTTAALDAGSQVRWRRDKRRISVAQPRGAALWSVAAEDTLVIDPGAMGATVEASGASLRVEVNMNGSDARAVGVSAATAIAVALVTVVVYQGSVRVRHDGQTVDVVPGARYEIRPPTAPEPIAVGGGPVDPRVRELEEEVKRLEAERDELLEQLPAKTIDACDEVSCVLNNYQGACCRKFKAQAPPAPTPAAPACDADALRQKGDDHLMTGMDAAALAAFEKSMACRPDAGLVAKSFMAACRSKNGPKAKQYFAQLSPDRQQSLAPICVRQGIAVDADGPAAARPPAAPCNASQLTDDGDDQLAIGKDAAALASFEKSLACKPDPKVTRKAYMAACRAKNRRSAQKHFDSIPGTLRSSLSQICIRNGIVVEDGPAYGVIKIISKPSAKIFLDGVDTRKTTPVELPASVGRHKITFDIRGDRFTFAVNVKEGETVTLSKQLE